MNLGLSERYFAALLSIAAFVFGHGLFKRGVYHEVKMALREANDRLADKLAEAPYRRASGLREGAVLPRQPERG